MSDKVLDVVKPGVRFGADVNKVFAIAMELQWAMPAVHVVGSDSVNATLEAAAAVKSPVIIQFSNGGAKFYAGKGIGGRSDVLGAISGAQHVHAMEAYGVCDSAYRSCGKKHFRGLMDCLRRVRRCLLSRDVRYLVRI